MKKRPRKPVFASSKSKLSPTTFHNGRIILHHGDCLQVLRDMPDNSVDAICTDPPYHLGFMGKHWDKKGGIAFKPKTWMEVLRVLKPGGHLVAFAAPKNSHRMVCAIEDAGFEIRESIMWLFGSGFPKSQNVSKAIDKTLGKVGKTVAKGNPVKRMIPGADQNRNGWKKNNGRVYQPGEYIPATDEAEEFEGYGTALKPAHEPICLARKPLSEKTVAKNVLRYGTGALNIDGCRVEADGEVIADDGQRVDTSCHDGYKRPGASMFKNGKPAIRGGPANQLGRWPANIVHDGSDEVVRLFPHTKSGSLLKTHTMRESENIAMSGKNYARHSSKDFLTNSGSAARFFYSTREGEASANKRYAKNGATNFAALPGERRNDSGSNARFFYSAKASKKDRAGSEHPTVKPVKLMEWLVTMVTPPGGVVLDPFAGTGTTGQAAYNLGFDCILIEREDEYVNDIAARFTKQYTILLEEYRKRLRRHKFKAASKYIYGYVNNRSNVA
jgi:DNA modification methylase